MINNNTRLMQYDPIVLAYIGDAYFSLVVRTRLATMSTLGAGALHERTKKYVSAVSQAQIWDRIMPQLDSIELDVGRRARNRHNNTTAKNATLEEYKKATALEAVIGYHYLDGNLQRLLEIMELILS